MRNFTWNRFPIKNLLIDSLLTPIVESTYLNDSSHLKKSAFPPHVTLYDETKVQVGCGDLDQHQKFGIIDTSVATSDILTWHHMWCSQTNFWCLMLWRQIWCWLDSCLFLHFLSFQDENKLDSWFLSFFNQSLTLISGVTRGLTLGDNA